MTVLWLFGSHGFPDFLWAFISSIFLLDCPVGPALTTYYLRSLERSRLGYMEAVSISPVSCGEIALLHTILQESGEDDNKISRRQ